MTLAWFDHFLRGVDNGVVDGPPARLYKLGLEEFVDEDVWPVPVVPMDL